MLTSGHRPPLPTPSNHSSSRPSFNTAAVRNLDGRREFAATPLIGLNSNGLRTGSSSSQVANPNDDLAAGFSSVVQNTAPFVKKDLVTANHAAVQNMDGRREFAATPLIGLNSNGLKTGSSSSQVADLNEDLAAGFSVVQNNAPFVKKDPMTANNHGKISAAAGNIFAAAGFSNPAVPPSFGSLNPSFRGVSTKTPSSLAATSAMASKSSMNASAELASRISMDDTNSKDGLGSTNPNHKEEDGVPLDSKLTLEHLATQIKTLSDKLEKSAANSKAGQSARRSQSRGRHSSRTRPHHHLDKGKPTTTGASWSQMVQNTLTEPPGSPVQQIPLKFFPPQHADGRVLVCPPSEITEEGVSRWQCTLVGYFIEGKPLFTVVRDQTMKLWGSKGLKNVMANDRGFFFFTFTSPAECTKILEAGPWIIQRQPIFLKPWQPGMKLFRETHDTVPLWVKLFNVPLEYWTENGFSYLGSAVGVPLYPDAMTASGRCVNFMRLCIEVSAENALVQNFDLLLPPTSDGENATINIRVDYPWKPKICHHCGVFGHTESSCFRKIREQKEKIGNHSHGDGSTQQVEGILNVVDGEDNTTELGNQQLNHPAAPLPPPVTNHVANSMESADIDGVIVQQEALENEIHQISPLLDVSKVRAEKEVVTSPNSFDLLLDNDEENLSEALVSSFAGKIQHIDGGEASARKKKKGKGGGGSTSHFGQNAQSRRS